MSVRTSKSQTEPSEGPWDEVRSRLRFAGGGFDKEAIPDACLTSWPRRSRLGGTATISYIAVPPVAFGPLTEAIGLYARTG